MVGISVRPLIQSEINSGQECVFDFGQSSANHVVLHDKGNDCNVRREFGGFDWVFGPDSDQKSIFETSCEPLISQVFSGFHAAFIACKFHFPDNLTALYYSSFMQMVKPAVGRPIQ